MSGLLGPCKRLAPVAAHTCRGLNMAVKPIQIRNFWDFTRPSDFRALIRDMDRQMERFERDLMDSFPFRSRSPRFIKLLGSDSDGEKYRLNLDLSDFKPEEIKVSLKDRVLKIHAKMDRSSEDGSRIVQEIMREVSLPENVNLTDIKSFIGTDGVLSIEAPRELAEKEKPKEIPVAREGGEK